MMIIQGFAPSPTSGFFKPVITDNMETTGAIGGGITLASGTYITIKVLYSLNCAIYTYLNNVKIKNSVAEYVVHQMLDNNLLQNKDIIIDIKCEVPISSGFGTSASSAYLTGILVNKLFNLGYNDREIAYIAHKTDIIFKTGLGSVCGLITPGFVLIYEAGAPYKAKTLKIDYDTDDVVFIIWREGISKKEILSNSKRLNDIARIGQYTLEKILENPNAETFFEECWNFAVNSKLATQWSIYAINIIKGIDGLVGVTQAQIGDAIFGMIKHYALNELKKRLYRIEGWKGYRITTVYKEKPKVLIEPQIKEIKI